ncbi:MAG TPA: hypothetical protein PKA13_07075 [Geminicoccaceae bacterium]|nr:hypothetical protein [Geminicoccus sp.]HMU49521.1 hypothetical protein [Geminicoccaceae bacterium]
MPISAFLIGASLPGQVLRAGITDRFQLVVSTPILAEVTRVLATKSGLRRYGYTEVDRIGFVHNLMAVAEVVETAPRYRRHVAIRTMTMSWLRRWPQVRATS